MQKKLMFIPYMNIFSEEKFRENLDEFDDIEAKLSDPSIISDTKKLTKLSQKRVQLQNKVNLIKEHQSLKSQLSDIQEQLKSEKDKEFIDVLNEEKSDLQKYLEKNEKALLIELLPKDPDDGKNVFLEIRAGTGGEEAALFARALFRMYARYFDKNKIKYDVISLTETGLDGLKEAIFLAKGKFAFQKLHLEAGGHRVQRIPETESQGRIHTSACTVAVIPEIEESEFEIVNSEIRVDYYRSSGPGGQSVNTTDSAVRLTHVPTGVIVTCQDEKSQIKNKAKAMTVLRARLNEIEKEKNHAQMAEEKKAQIGSGDRSQRIRTYNFPQNRVTDHRINYTSHNLDKIMEGELDEIIEALLVFEQNEKLKNM